MSLESSNPTTSGRRQFIKGVSSAVAGATLAGATQVSGASRNKKMPNRSPLSTTTYNWMSFYRLDGGEFESDLPRAVAEVKQSGADHFEPNLKSLDYVDTLSDELQKQGIGMQSVYVNSELWDNEKAKASIDWVLTIARRDSHVRAQSAGDHRPAGIHRTGVPAWVVSESYPFLPILSRLISSRVFAPVDIIARRNSRRSSSRTFSTPS